MQVGREHKGVGPQPVHDGDGLRLPGVSDGDVLVGEVAIQVVVVAVVPANCSLPVT